MNAFSHTINNRTMLISMYRRGDENWLITAYNLIIFKCKALIEAWERGIYLTATYLSNTKTLIRGLKY